MWWMGFGRGRGGWFGPWPGRGPFSYLPPWQRPGWLFRMGFGWWWNPYVCVRFPWLPRWWAYPDAYGYSYAYPTYTYSGYWW